MDNTITVYTDGGSRGNPGPAGIGGVAIFPGGHKIKFSEFIGDNKTNNEAEYEALIFALRIIKKNLGKKMAKESRVCCYLDSELVVKQLNHEYKLRDERIQKYFIEIWNLMLDYYIVDFHHIPREQNKEADSLVNRALDQYKASLF